MEFIYSVLDIFFFVFHTALILFNGIGLIWKRTRKWNLLTLILTGSSWFLLGIWKGWGYCICTDWHYQVRTELGYDIGVSYINFLIKKFTGIILPESAVDTATLVLFLVCLALSIILNVLDYRKKIASSKRANDQ